MISIRLVIDLLGILIHIGIAGGNTNMLDYRTHTFLEVYRQRSFTQAARSLMITQPAVSQHIKQLESHYGCPLFVKTGRGIEPTPAATVLYQRLLTMENDDARLVAEVGRLTAAPTKAREAPLKLGCTRTIADFMAPQLVAAHLVRHPNSPVTLRAGNTRDLVGALDRGDIDFALVEGSFDRERFDYEILSREPYITIAGRVDAKGIVTPGAGGGVAHGAGTKTEVGNPADAEQSASPTKFRTHVAQPSSIRDLLGERLILREAGSGTREILEKHLAARDLAVTDFAGVVELESIPTIKACVRSGAGITFMYRVAAAEELARGEFVDITPVDFFIEHDFCLIWQRGSQYAPRYRALCKAWHSLP